jgi:hypothetical protein
MVATAPAEPAATVRLSLTAILAAEAVTAGAPTTGLTGEPGAEATAAAEATRTATPPVLHVAASTLAKKIEELRRKKSSTLGDNDGFPAFSARLHNLLFSRRNSNLWGSPSTTRSKIQYSDSDATPSPSKMLVAITTRSASTSPSAWIKLCLHGSSHLRSTRS